ncbi:MAG TPA: heavy metal translocating P-type ATPase, partial [Firmicutes bacterium]|nr:heavy metal translocating P-type ATPase [Bacillota bacterium]
MRPENWQLWLRKNEKLLIIIVSGALIILGWLMGYFSPLARAILMTAAALAAGFPIAKTAWYALRAEVISIHLLVTIAALGGILIGDQWE